MALIDDLKEQLIALVDNKRANLKKGCSDCSCDAQIDALTDRIAVIEFTGHDYTTGGDMNTIVPKTKTPKILTITLADFESDGFTYLNSAYQGVTEYLVYLNNSGNRWLTFEDDGFIRLPQGGFVIDPNKLNLESIIQLIILAP